MPKEQGGTEKPAVAVDHFDFHTPQERDKASQVNGGQPGSHLSVPVAGRRDQKSQPNGSSTGFCTGGAPSVRTGALAEHRPGVAIIILITMHVVAIETPGQPGDKSQKSTDTSRRGC
ncbi:mitochondrial inner membrane translocase subunit [Aspergillus luchuensis]|uniref:Mitochondrial inner membrane translocase subunit n=1 Tax=Aspergillus kawachii TaxID=1069201 RepID=A0A146EY37_ASPKA|nr:mitochondrial inner membrane translocase subunit [Aspergillus luchuensis]